VLGYIVHNLPLFCSGIFLSVHTGGVLFRMPKYASKFIEMCLMVTADHGPAVSGAHNTIVCARAGKDLVSSLASGLLTIVSHVYFFSSTCRPIMSGLGCIVE